MILAAFVLSSSGCATDSLAEQFREGDNKNYIAGDGTVTEFALGSRPKAADWSGVSESGENLSMQEQFLSDEVQFIGVNVRDTAETALAFARQVNLNFPSVMDAKTGSVVLGFTGVVTPQAVPTTLVIDSEGNVSARVLGRIDKGILEELIKTVVREKN